MFYVGSKPNKSKPVYSLHNTFCVGGSKARFSDTWMNDHCEELKIILSVSLKKLSCSCNVAVFSLLNYPCSNKGIVVAITGRITSSEVATGFVTIKRCVGFIPQCPRSAGSRPLALAAVLRVYACKSGSEPGFNWHHSTGRLCHSQTAGVITECLCRHT